LTVTRRAGSLRPASREPRLRGPTRTDREQALRAAVCREFGRPLAVEEVDLAAPGRGEVAVRVAACAVCHSDVLAIDGAWDGSLPAVFGHEAAGVVEEVGPGVGHVRPGDHVVVTLVRYCGTCPACARGEPPLCEAGFPLDTRSPLAGRGDGAPIRQGLRTGAFAERVVVDASQAVPIPREVPLESASLLACGVITGLGAVLNVAAIRPGSRVVTIGTGGVGLNCVQGAALCGARRTSRSTCRTRSWRRPGPSAPTGRSTRQGRTRARRSSP
jgi:Zn-dependent alcohol dehydrogenase